MHRTSRNNAICFKGLEEALEKCPETYRHLDLIAFGFPCQDISNANPKGKGLEGKRSSIFFECMRIVNILNPTWLLIENVPRLLSINEGRDFTIVLQTLSESGYGYSWRILDSQYFGVAQRRRRVFIVGCFGNFCPPEILFEQKSGCGNDKKKPKMGQRGLCISTKDGERQDPTNETIIASTIGTSINPDPNYGTHFIAEAITSYPAETMPPSKGAKRNLVCQTIRGQDCPQVGNKGAVKHNFVAQTLGATPRGNTSFVWQDTYIAETDANGKRNIARFAKGLDSRRGIVIGNGVTVQAAEWIAKRIIKYGLQNK